MTFHFKKTVPDFAWLKGVTLDIQQRRLVPGLASCMRGMMNIDSQLASFEGKALAFKRELMQA